MIGFMNKAILREGKCTQRHDGLEGEGMEMTVGGCGSSTGVRRWAQLEGTVTLWSSRCDTALRNWDACH